MEFSAKHFGLLTREVLLAAGSSPSAISRKLRSGELRRVYQDVYRVTSAPPSWNQSVLAPCLRRPGHVWVCGRTAGAFWDLDGRRADVFEVVTVCRLRRVDAVVVHWVAGMPERDVTVVHNIPVTTVHRTLVDLGGVATPNCVEMALECALRRRITSVDRWWRLIEAVGTTGRRGPAVLAEILKSHARRPTESSLETRFVQFTRRFKLPPPSRQLRLRDESGLLARVDFIWDSQRVIVEVDSRSHHLRREQWEADLRRRNALTSRGFLVLHVTHDRLGADPESIAHEITLALQRDK